MSNLSFKGLKSRSFIIFFAHNKESVVFAERQGFHPQGGRTESLSKEPECSHRQPHSSGLDPGSSASPACPSLSSPGCGFGFPWICWGLAFREHRLDSALQVHIRVRRGRPAQARADSDHGYNSHSWMSSSQADMTCLSSLITRR